MRDDYEYIGLDMIVGIEKATRDMDDGYLTYLSEEKRGRTAGAEPVAVPQANSILTK